MLKNISDADLLFRTVNHAQPRTSFVVRQMIAELATRGIRLPN